MVAAICFTQQEFYWHGLHPCVPLEQRVTVNQYKALLIVDLYPMMKHLYPEGSLFQDDNIPMHRTRGLAEWFDEYRNYINHTLWPSVTRSQPK